MSDACNDFMVEQERMALRQAEAALAEAQRVVDEQRERLRRRELAPRERQADD